MKYFMTGLISIVLIAIGGFGYFTGSHNWGWWLFAAGIVWFQVV